MNFKLRQLQGFVAAANHSSFSAGARELALTQPAFSQLIRELETALCVKLFERTTRRVELTDAGRRLLAMIERPLDDLGDAYKVMRDIASGARGRIVFASLPSVAFGFVTAALARYKLKHPEISVRLIEDQNLVLVDRVLHREVDFGIGTLTVPHRELAFRELLQDELLAVYPEGHALQKRPRITWRDLALETLVLLPKQSSVRELTEHGFAAAGRVCEPEYEVANMVTALGMVRARLAITVMPRIALEELNTGGLRSSAIAEPHPARSIGVITRADRPLSPAAAAYVELLAEATAAKPRAARKPKAAEPAPRTAAHLRAR